MRIVIVGAGAVGSHLAERLSSERQDIVVVESDRARAAELQAELDVLVVVGNGASPTTLEEAEVERADMLIAVTSSDATNVLAAHAAGRLGVERLIDLLIEIARARDVGGQAEEDMPDIPLRRRFVPGAAIAKISDRACAFVEG